MRLFSKFKGNTRGNKKDLMKKLNQGEKVALVEKKNRFSIWNDYLGSSETAKRKKELLSIKDNEDKFVLAGPAVTAKNGGAKGRVLKIKQQGLEFKLYEPPEFDDALTAQLQDVETKIGYRFKNLSLLSMAFTHRSALGYNSHADYERLEFLGDAVLDLVIAHLLCEYHIKAKEGDLSKMRAALVNTQSLANFAKELGFSSYVKLGRNESHNDGANRPSILADVVEAIVGAVFLDGGYSSAFNVAKKMFGTSIEQVVPSDPKTELQEALHVSGSDLPQYLLKCVEGPEHSPNFVTVVLVDGEVVGFGNGATKKASQQEAAAFALARTVTNAVRIPLKKGQKEIIAHLLNCDCRPEKTEKLEREFL